MHPQTIALKIVLLIVALTLLPPVDLCRAGQISRPDYTPAVEETLEDYRPKHVLVGYFTIAVVDNLVPLMDILARKFQAFHPELRVAVLPTKEAGGSGSGSFMDHFLNRRAKLRLGYGHFRGEHASNDVRLVAVNRKLEAEEKSAFISRFGYRPLEIPFAKDAVAFYVHYQNPIQGLTLEEVQSLFSESSKEGSSTRPRKWGEVGVKHDGWDFAPIHLYLPDKRSGRSTRVSIQEYAILNRPLAAEVIERPGSASAVLSIANDRYGIGGADWGLEIPHVRLLPLAKKPKLPYVAPTTQTIMNGTYPLSHFLYLYANKSPSENLSPELSEFFLYVNSRTAQQNVIKNGRFPLTSSEVRRNLQILDLGSTPPLTAKSDTAH